MKMNITRNMALAFMAVSVYLAGGAFVFSGIGLMAFAKDVDLFGWGDGATIGTLWVAVGLVLSIIGVLLTRICRNRGLLDQHRLE